MAYSWEGLEDCQQVNDGKGGYPPFLSTFAVVILFEAGKGSNINNENLKSLLQY